jgi:predicted kinase
MPILIIFGGLAGTGKTAIAKQLARELDAVYLRIDSVEQAIRDCGVASKSLDDAGYRIGYAVAEDNLRLGRTVIADSVNPLRLTRDAWKSVADRALARAIEVEVICSDTAQHRNRVETRNADIKGLRLPTWQEVVSREYEPWERDHIVIDTANRSVAANVEELLKALMKQDSLRIHKGGHDIDSIDDWFKWAPPKMGERHWKDGRSAKELARSWVRQGYGCPPKEMRLLLEGAFNEEITFHEAKPECVIALDDFGGEHRNCDLVVLCGVGMLRMAINVEAKADEPFGDDTIGDYYDGTADSRSNVPARIRQLSLALFGRVPDAAIRKLRYQLLHAAAATLIEAAANRAELGLFLVHEFRPPRLNEKKLAQNSADWENFVHVFPELAGARVEKDQILGPVSVPGGGRVPCSVPLYLGKLVTEPK